MLRSRLFFIILISVLLVGSSIVLWAVAKDDDDEEIVPLSEVPKVVLDAANNEVPGGKILSVEREVEDGEVIYDVDIVVDGVEYEVEVTAKGDVLETEKEGDAEDDDEDDREEDVALTSVPAEVLEAAKGAVPDGRIVKVEKEVEDGEVIYEVEMVVEYEVAVTVGGEVKEVEIEGDEEDDDLDSDEEDEEDDD